ncbi:alpha/beta hydrolase [Subtercola sp. Z020]|uniref:alpha/beta fold hydrolase n=1 Tax=Subtercola sp. Z020 TaxID=2080582 RepID=UPI000CE89433|nr:alpha/beta hydrolase [Subtercola sp. Z020]PPF79163.1 alpha/beta hydrolase [Subtercola sp. Z020]
MTTPDGTIFFLPGLGFGAAAAEPLAKALGDRFRVVGIDLPGHGLVQDAPDATVSAIADSAVASIEALADGGPFLLVAHSMGGKVAALVAARVFSGRANLFGLAGAVLLSPSPTSAEPMADDKRELMLSWAAAGSLSKADATEFLAQNVAQALGHADERDAVSQVRQTTPLSWRRWLTDGSREDVSAAAGMIELPVVVVAGEDDDDLGATAQQGYLGVVFPRSRLVALADTGHLLPYERAPEVAAEIVRLWESTVGAAPRVPAEWGRVIASSRTSAEARALLARRALADDPEYAPQALSADQLALLRSLAEHLVPQTGAGHIDIAARVDADLAAGRGDGWRAAGLPADIVAYRQGLDALAAVWPHDAAGQRAVLERLFEDEVEDAPGHAEQTAAEAAPVEQIAGELGDDGLTRWFEDVRNDLVRSWLAHPASLARVGYDGFATSGSESGPAGYVALAADTRDPWEPAELGAVDTTDADTDRTTHTVSTTHTDSAGTPGEENAA